MTQPLIAEWVRDLLRCPQCLAELRDEEGGSGPELVCTSDACGLIYPVEDGIPVLLIDKARPRG